MIIRRPTQCLNGQPNRTKFKPEFYPEMT